jgi:deuterolysin
VNHNALSDTAFTSLAGGKSMEIHVEMASIHDLSSGGAYTVTSSGRIPFAEKGSNSLKGAFSYQSNDVVVHVNGHQASKVPKALRAKKHSERSLVSDCGGDQYTTAELAQTDCDWLATEAAYQALNGDVGKFVTR